MNTVSPLDIQASRLWTETLAWLSSHSLQIAIGTAAAAVIVVVLLGIKWLGRRICRTDPTHTHWRTVVGRVLTRTKLWFMVALAARLVVGYAQPPQVVAMTIGVLFIVAATLQAALWARELVIGVIEFRAGELDQSSSLGSAIGIIRLLVTVAIFAIALVVVLDNLGVNVTGLVAGLGIGGIAIGLAAQGIFSDLFAALSIIFDKPFRRGDTITFGTMTGTVEQIGLKTTRIRSLTGEEVVMSNAKLLDQQLQNWALLERRRNVMTFGVTYQTPPDMLARIPLEIKEIVEAQPLGTFDRCHATTFAASSIDFELVFHTESADMADFMSVRQAIMLGMMRKFEELGVEFAYPTQTSFTAGPDGKAIMPYPEVQPVKRVDLREGE
ncbi:mechanosensitive ion channel family protein [Sphingosinicella sp. LHD-64]|uniref:mechanosensitive ion channel family protein n=1 Tax=Sphingosinicella sp. LHD-64 TaxID=3072139 RepID=UPI00280D56BB|nr:mechanosensitive ion channel family protein [Sphingosinicella sp. LHD-64]MDQ8757497.1 mechanosensitive ion channel family protein [Sphingosinicella sp. LHD-64]